MRYYLIPLGLHLVSTDGYTSCMVMANYAR